MEITEVRIKLMEESEDRLRAFCSITFDHCFVVRDLKIIEGTSGAFVAMPSRKLTGRCNRCGYKNHLRSNYCNQCGTRLRGGNDMRDVESGSNRLYADIAHPINQVCRDLIQNAVVHEYHLEVERAKLPGYQSRYDDDYFDTLLPAETMRPTDSNIHGPGHKPAPHLPNGASKPLEANNDSTPVSNKDASQRFDQPTAHVAPQPNASNHNPQPPLYSDIIHPTSQLDQNNQVGNNDPEASIEGHTSLLGSPEGSQAGSSDLNFKVDSPSANVPTPHLNSPKIAENAETLKADSENGDTGFANNEFGKGIL